MLKLSWRLGLLLSAALLAIVLLVVVLFAALGNRPEALIQLEAMQSMAANGARLPRLSAMPGGGVIMSWVEPTGAQHVLKYAVLKDGRWQRDGVVTQGSDWFVNWSDFPSVVAVGDTFWLAHWLVKQSGGNTYDYDIALAISNDAGMNWRSIGSPHRDDKAAEHGFVSIFPDRGAAGIIWLDGRDYNSRPAPTGHDEHHASHAGNFALRYTRVLADGSMEPEQVVDDNTCSCCRTTVAAVPEGVLAAWRGRTNDEIRDNRIARLVDGSWTASRPLGDEGWRIAGCPVNGPALAARENRVLAAWFTAEGDRPRVRAAISHDGGQVFSAPVDLDDQLPLGRIEALWLDEKRALVSWMANPRKKTSELVVRIIDTNEQVREISSLGKLSAGRDSGVPQMVRDGNHLYVAWTRPQPDFGIALGHIPVAQLHD
ncbi:MAG: sialidase family protein [Porticoccaceae bacterium]